MIDIIIPAYNSHNTIERALDSIVKQVIKDSVTVFIVDDGSKDSYDSIVSKYNNLLDIKLIRIDNSGPGNARNVGLKNTSNPYIVFLDSDDYLYDEYSLSNLLEVIKDNDLAQGKYLKIDKDEKVVKDPLYCYLHGKMYKRSIIENNNLEFEVSSIKEGDIYEDSIFNQLYTLCCDKIGTTDKIIYSYVYNEESLTRKEANNVKNLKNYIKAINYFIDEINKRNIDKKKEIAWYMCMAMHHVYFNYFIYPDESSFVFDECNKLLDIYNKNIEYLPKEEVVDIYDFYKNYPVKPNMTLEEFIKKIH